MSRVRNRDELLDEIGLLVDEYIEYILKKGKRKKLKKFKEVSDKSNVEEEKPDLICMAKLKNGKRCSREKKKDITEDEDPELCKLHNNPKYKDKIEKIVIEKTKDSVSSNESSNDEGEEDVVEISLTVDPISGYAIDQNGNVWDTEEVMIIGKRDPKTKEITMFKKV